MFLSYRPTSSTISASALCCHGFRIDRGFEPRREGDGGVPKSGRNGSLDERKGLPGNSLSCLAKSPVTNGKVSIVNRCLKYSMQRAEETGSSFTTFTQRYQRTIETGVSSLIIIPPPPPPPPFFFLLFFFFFFFCSHFLLPDKSL